MDPVPLFWLAVSAVSWWVGACAASVRHELVRLESGEGGEEDYALLAMLRRLQDDPVGLSLRLRFSRFFASALVPLALAAAVGEGGWAWTTGALAVGWLAAAFPDAVGGGRLLRWTGRRGEGALYGVWARLTQPAARVALFLLTLRAGSRRKRRGTNISIEAESRAGQTVDESRLGSEERRLLHRFLTHVGNEVVGIMTPWDRVAWVEGTARVSEASSVAHDSGHSRLPVVVKEKVVGVVTVKDLLPKVHDPQGANVTVDALARPAHFVSGEATVRQLLEELQEARRHLAVVVDRLGRHVGVVTMEDLLEEMVGELHDERERERPREAG